MSSFSRLPARLRCLWAKSGTDGGHGLLAHMLDVSAVAEVILLAEPAATRRWAAQAFGLPDADAVRWVAALVGLHDLGKAIPGFQTKWPPGRQADEAAGLPFIPVRALQCDRHSQATAALLGPLLEACSGASAQWCQHVVQAVGAHHGYHFTTTEVDDGVPLREPTEWAHSRSALLQVYWDVLAPQGVPNRDSCDLPGVNWLAGLTSAADWIASNPQWFPPGERREDLSDYHRHAMQLAAFALPHLGWHAWSALSGGAARAHQLLARMMGRPDAEPRPLQLAGDSLLQDSSGPVLLLVEAPMGEGKTELAFLAHLRLQARQQHRGLYVALPTQATGNALFRRACTFLEAFAPGRLDVQLVHGGAVMNEDLAELRSVGDSAADTLSANAWFGQRSRPLLSPYGVGTVDQALYAVLNVKHHFVRLWGLSNRVVVLDEVHAYDTYTSGLIDALLRWLKALNCSVVLMSATLPRARSQALLRAWGATGVAPEPAYPRLRLVDDAGIRGEHVQARRLAPIQLHGLDSGVEPLADLALAQVEGGGCGAIIVNTVSRAQALYGRLKLRLADKGAADVELLLFHARFPADQRQRLESRVLQCFGVQPAGQQARPARALLVATQVAEQSLDIDFDFMLTDLAPVDLLLQRAGRLHRHRRENRPGAHAQARLWVAGLLPQTLPDFKGTAWGFVYDPFILGRTWALLSREAVLNLPQDIDRLVQAVYDSNHELPDDLDEDARSFIEVQAHGEHCSAVKTKAQMAANIVIDPSDLPDACYDRKPRGHEEDETGLGLTNSTRLGDESVTVVPVFEGYDGKWSVQPGDVGFDPEFPLEEERVRALYARQLKLSRKRVVKRLQATPRPVSFAEHALLRHMWPLRLRDRRSVDEMLRVSLCEELGLMYDDAGTSEQVHEDAE